MKITDSALRRPVTVLMIFASFIVLGVITGQMLPLEFFPKFELPFVGVDIPYPNSTPEEVERQITRPVEEVLSTMSGIKNMNSSSRENGCNIGMEFSWGTDTNSKALEVREKIDSIRNQLPADLERFVVGRATASDNAMLMIRISSKRDISNAYDLLNRRLKRRIERISGVSRVTMYGVSKKEIRVQLIANRIIAHQVDLGKLSRELATGNFMLTAGKITATDQRFLVRPLGEIKTPEQLGELVIGNNNLKLRDIAIISYQSPELFDGRHLNRTYAIGLDVFKESGANIVAVANKIKKEIADVNKDPEMEGINMFMLDDQAEGVTSSLVELLKSGILGTLLAIIILYIFLRQWTTTLIVAMAVPFSLLPTLVFMYFSGISLNILSMLGLLVAVGMLVDNAVVVTENIYRHQKTVPDKKEAARRGAKEVALAITAGTFTTAIVFVPNIISDNNEISLQIKHVAVSFCIALGISLLLAQTVVPLLTTKIKASKYNGKTNVFDRLALRYKKVLHWLISKRKYSVLLIIFTLLSGIVAFVIMKKDMFPPQQDRQLFLRFNINDNYTKEKVEAAVDVIEEYLYSNKDKFDIDTIYSYYHGGQAQSTIKLNRGAKARKHQEQIKKEIREGMPTLSVGRPSFGRRSSRGGETMRILLSGPSTEQLIELSRQVAWTLNRIPGLVDVHSSANRGKREIQVVINRERARKLGFSSTEIARNIEVGMRGINLRRFHDDEGEIVVRVEYQKEDKRKMEDLNNLILFKDTRNPVKLSALADFKSKRGPTTIRRENRITSLSVVMDLKDISVPQARRRINTVMKNYKLPAGYTWGYGRSRDYEQESLNTMLTNMVLALVLIYFVMASLFESLLFPAAIWTSIFFAIIGVFWSFVLTGTNFQIMGLFGILILMGVVVNNGIVLIDYINQLRANGISRHDAILQAGSHRIRPILMTAGTTVLSLFPLCLTTIQIGGGGPPYFPMARAIAGGLVFSTAVTLIILPTIYILLDDLRNWTRKIIARANR